MEKPPSSYRKDGLKPCWQRWCHIVMNTDLQDGERLILDQIGVSSEQSLVTTGLLPSAAFQTGFSSVSVSLRCTVHAMEENGLPSRPFRVLNAST